MISRSPSHEAKSRDTATEGRAHVLDERISAAQRRASLEADPNVKALQTMFGAELRPESIELINPSPSRARLGKHTEKLMKGGIGQLMKQAQQMQADMKKGAGGDGVASRWSGESGGGMVKVTMTCKHRAGARDRRHADRRRQGNARGPHRRGVQRCGSAKVESHRSGKIRRDGGGSYGAATGHEVCHSEFESRVLSPHC